MRRQETTERTAWKVGDLAEQTRLSVRTLHHYDEIGLLSPSGRTEGGHRLYSAEDVLRLQQIRSLRALGFGLGEIRECLENPGFSAQRVIEMHVSGLKERYACSRSSFGASRRLRRVYARRRRSRSRSLSKRRWR